MPLFRFPSESILKTIPVKIEMKFTIVNTSAGIMTYQRDFFTKANTSNAIMIGVALYLIETKTVLKVLYLTSFEK